MPFYGNPVRAGTDAVKSLGDGYQISVSWFEAYPNIVSNKIAYNLYYSTVKEDVFTDGVKYVSIDVALQANLIDLVPGQMYWVGVRPIEYNPTLYDLTQLPIAYDNLRLIPQSVLRQDIGAEDLIIPLMDVSGFPTTGIIQAGVELIRYLAVDGLNNDLVLGSSAGRGYNNTIPAEHLVDGYDGYVAWSPFINYHVIGESKIFDRLFMCQSRFEYPNFPYTLIDGYKQVTQDILNEDLTASDEANIGFPEYDFAGWHRTDPVELLNGTCVGSYIGGEMGCIDGNGNINILRGFSAQDNLDNREEILLSVTGVPAVLIQRQNTGITCACYQPNAEVIGERCPFCYGTKFVLGYQQYFNPRQSDGRIMVRLSPTDENVKLYDAGLESEFPIEMWTLVLPAIHVRDILVLFDQDGNESFRYEVISVNRNNTFLQNMGAQKFRVIRIRKTDIAYQIRVFSDTAMFPTKLNTSITIVPGALPAHSHVITRNETDPSNWSQLTEVSQGHNHEVIIENGFPTVQETLGHTHQIIL